MVEEFKTYLNKIGLKYTQTPQSEILMFNTNNLNYIFQWQESDPYYFRLSLPNVDSEMTNDIQRIAMELNAQYKVAKVIEMPDHHVWIIAEAFVYSFDKIEALFSRMVFLLSNVIDEYRNKKGGGGV